MTEEVHHRKGGGRAARQSTRKTSNAIREPYLTRLIKPYEMVSEEGLQTLEDNADAILEEIGVEIRDYPSAIERFKNAGAIVDGTRVRFPRGMCRSIIQASAPRMYTQHARNPENNVQIGGDGTPRPYLHVRGGLFALVNRATFYRLADLALAEGAEPPGLWSDGAFFPFMQGIDDAA